MPGAQSMLMSTIIMEEITTTGATEDAWEAS